WKLPPPARVSPGESAAFTDRSSATAAKTYLLRRAVTSARRRLNASRSSAGSRVSSAGSRTGARGVGGEGRHLASLEEDLSGVAAHLRSAPDGRSGRGRAQLVRRSTVAPPSVGKLEAPSPRPRRRARRRTAGGPARPPEDPRPPGAGSPRRLPG